MKYLIKGGRVVDPANKIDGIYDVLIVDGKIDRVGKGLDIKSDETIDAKDRIVAPGLIDMHVHLREPGREDKETILTGSRAAVRGGFTAVACMPNTKPAIDSSAMIKTVKEIADGSALCKVFIVGAITEGRAGKKLTDFGRMKTEGAVAVSDDGSSIQDKDLMFEAMKGCKKNSLLLIDHCENAAITADGVMNRSFVATKMGLRGMPREAEYEFVRRDIELAGKTSARIHIAHVSCRESVELIKMAKREGLDITAETAPHYFTLTEDCCVAYDTNTKMNPPLRGKEDVEAIKKALSGGAIDAIATDHAPHTDSEKDVEFDYAPFGIIGLETALSLAVMELIEKKIISWPELVSKMSVSPAGILGVGGGNLKAGKTADLIIIDPAKEYVYKKDSIESKSKNSPFIDWRLKARVSHVFVGGRLAMKDETIL